MISCSYWPDACTPTETVFDLINKVRTVRSIRPIVVHDLLGGHRAGKILIQKISSFQK